MTCVDEANTPARWMRSFSVTRSLLVLAVSLPPITELRAQYFTYATNNGTLTVTSYVGAGAVVIPSEVNGLSVTSIGSAAFKEGPAPWNQGPVTSVTIPNSVTNIGYGAFSTCTGMTNLSMGTGVTSIEGYAFEFCAFTSVTLPMSLISIGDGAFADCTNLRSVNIPNSVKTIGDYVCWHCHGLTSVTIDNGVTSVGNWAFAYCYDLTNLIIPNSVTSIGTNAFASCTSLTSVTLPYSITNLGSLVFFGCSSLRLITVDGLNPVYSSVDGVLLDKYQTTLIEYPMGKVGSYTIPDSVINIGSGAFEGSDLTNVTLPDRLISIGESAFRDCSSLTSVTIPNSVKTIGAIAFYGCSSLTSVTIPNSVTSLEAWTFSDCYSLTNVTISNGVTSLGSYLFENCPLTSIIIPESVTNIVAAFEGCANLTGFYFKGNSPGTGQIVVNNATVYYLPGTAGWGPIYAGLPTAVWKLPYPVILSGSVGLLNNGFGFIVSWATNLSVVVEANTNLTEVNWLPVSTNQLIGGSSYFSDPQWTNYPTRFYRIRSP